MIFVTVSIIPLALAFTLACLIRRRNRRWVRTEQVAAQVTERATEQMCITYTQHFNELARLPREANAEMRREVNNA